MSQNRRNLFVLDMFRKLLFRFICHIVVISLKNRKTVNVNRYAIIGLSEVVTRITILQHKNVNSYAAAQTTDYLKRQNFQLIFNHSYNANLFFDESFLLRYRIKYYVRVLLRSKKLKNINRTISILF